MIKLNKIQILEKLDKCISIIKETDNIYVRKQLELIAEALIREWNESDNYYNEIRQVLNYDETFINLDNIKI